MEISPQLLEAQSLNASLLAKSEGFLSMLRRRGSLDKSTRQWEELLDDSIASHTYCEEVLRQAVKKIR